jgi:hypothetical protein
VAALAFGAGLVYLGYRAKKKVEAIQQAYTHDDQTGTSGASTGDTSSLPPLPGSTVFSTKPNIPSSPASSTGTQLKSICIWKIAAPELAVIF